MNIKSGFKYRIYPNQEQQDKLAVQFGHTRFVYNLYLATRRDYYAATGKSSGYHDCANDLTKLKKEADHAWLKEADSQALQQSLKDLDAAFGRFFKGLGGYPKFKSRHHKQSYRYPQRFKLNESRIYLPKVGWVKIVLHRAIRGKMKSCTVSRTKTGKYFVSILCEWELEQPDPTHDSVGIDLGISHFAILSTGEKIDNPRHLKRAERRLKIRQRRLSRKKKGSSNRDKARRRVAATHEKIANQRRDFHHKTSRELVDRFGYIALESLNVSGMMKNHKLAKVISDVGWSQFVNFLIYKQGWSGGTVDQIDQWYPSSKTCSDCGAINRSLKLSTREWYCDSCGAIHDRDTNAGINILNHSLNTNTVGATEIYAREIRPVVRQSAREAQLL